MAINPDILYSSMLTEAQSSFGAGWDAIKTYAPAEFKKLTTQLVDIANNVAKYELDPNQGFSPETGKLLLKMQLNATESVLVAVSTLTLLAVQNAINGILQILKNTFSELVPIL